jgi:putative flavoprotein involved in K+ transport
MSIAMKRTDVLIIGGGQAGLAMSRCLLELSIDHVIVERGRVAESWRSQRWDSLRLLTPSWQSRLPGWSYQGSDPNGFMTMPEIIAYLAGYARSFAAPVYENTEVVSVMRDDEGYVVVTTAATWRARSVVIATGICSRPRVPSFGRDLPGDIHQTSPIHYRNPTGLPDGGVLVVGASASGLQLADELQRSGRDVTLAVGRHTRIPRSYRGQDIMWWLDRTGILDQTSAEVRDLERSRQAPSFQLVGRPDHADLDLPGLASRGVRLVGRALGSWGHRMYFDDNLAGSVMSAEAKLHRLLGKIDTEIRDRGLERRLPAPSRPQAPRITDGPGSLDLRRRGIATVVWATGFRPHYPWLRVSVLGPGGALQHREGRTEAPGLYALGLRFMRRRNSNFIDGVRHDARELSREIYDHLNRGRLAA